MSGRSAAGWLVFALPTCHHQRPPVGGSSRNESLARDDRCKGEWRLAERATGRRAAPSALIFLINRSTVDDECCYLRLSVFFPAAPSLNSSGTSGHITKSRRLVPGSKEAESETTRRHHRGHSSVAYPLGLSLSRPAPSLRCSFPNTWRLMSLEAAMTRAPNDSQW